MMEYILMVLLLCSIVLPIAIVAVERNIRKKELANNTEPDEMPDTREIVIGGTYVFKCYAGNPFLDTIPDVIKVLEVKNGWVKFLICDTIFKDSQRVEHFLNCRSLYDDSKNKE